MFKECTNCSENFIFGNFTPCKHVKSGLQSWCRKCSSVDNMDRDKKNPEGLKKRKKKHRQTEKYKETTKLYNENNRENNEEYRKSYYEENRDKILLRGRIGNLKKFGLDLDGFNKILISQNGVCKICSKTNNGNRSLAVDHDHSCCPGKKSCGKCIRGLLCGNCNTSLGKLGDNEEGLKRALAYVKGEL